MNRAKSEPIHVTSYTEGNETLTRIGGEYRVNGRKVSLKQAFRWFVRMEEKPDGNGDTWEQYRFLKAVAKLLK